MTEVGRAVLEQPQRDGIPYITVTHDVENLQSGAVIRKLDMKYCCSYEKQWKPKG